MTFETLTAFFTDNKTWFSVAGLLVFLLWESAVPFFGFFQGKTKKRGIHAVMNILIAQINVLMVSTLFVGLWLYASQIATQQQFGVANWLPVEGVWHLLVVMFLLDFWTYLWHVINHKIPFFWSFHQVHHSDKQMDVTTASRFHIGEILFSSILRTGIIVLIGAHIWELFIYEIFLTLVIQFHHANIGLPEWLDKTLRVFIVTPAMHKVHHSEKQKETDSNYTSLFSWWDRICGTFKLRKDPKKIVFGLKFIDQKTSDDFSDVMGLPFKKK